MKIKTNSPREQLQYKIKLLKHQQSQQLLDVKSQFNVTAKSLKPSAIIAKTVMDLKNEPKFKGAFTNTLLSMVTGFLSRKAIVGKSNSILKSILGYAVQYATTKIVASKIKN